MLFSGFIYISCGKDSPEPTPPVISEENSENQGEPETPEEPNSPETEEGTDSPETEQPDSPETEQPDSPDSPENPDDPELPNSPTIDTNQKYIDLVYCYSVSEVVLKYLQPTLTITTDDGESVARDIKESDCIPSSNGYKYESLSLSIYDGGSLTWFLPMQLQGWVHKGVLTVTYTEKGDVPSELAHDYFLISNPFAAVGFVTPGTFSINISSYTNISLTIRDYDTTLDEAIHKIASSTDVFSFETTDEKEMKKSHYH